MSPYFQSANESRNNEKFFNDDPQMMLLHKLYHKHVDTLRVHYEYSMEGKGFDYVKKDFFNLLEEREK